jgi:hypothetical protein
MLLLNLVIPIIGLDLLEHPGHELSPLDRLGLLTLEGLADDLLFALICNNAFLG